MPEMQYESCTANDGCTLSFQTSIPLSAVAVEKPQHCILLMHGFSGSSDYFTRNFDDLRKHSWVVAPDMRGHGRSGRTKGGYHVARLAADLHSLVSHLCKSAGVADDGDDDDDDDDDVGVSGGDRRGRGRGRGGPRIFPVGCSIGAAVLWTYVELFGNAPFSGFVFVDQAPLQDRAPRFDGWDETKAHTGCYDEATMLAAQEAWIEDPAAAHAGLVEGCLGYRQAPGPDEGDLDEAERGRRRQRREDDEKFFASISALCDQRWLARLLSDHTRYDHREAVELLARPTLVMAGRKSGCFPLEGMLETVRRVDGVRPGLARASVFDAGHWLFYEEPDRFNEEILEFVTTQH